MFHDKDDEEAEDEDDDTENVIDEFSTDSDINSEDGACYSGHKRSASLDPSTTPSTERHYPFAGVLPGFDGKSSKSSSTLVEDKELSQLSLTCDNLKGSLATDRLKERGTWSKETLF